MSEQTQDTENVQDNQGSPAEESFDRDEAAKRAQERLDALFSGEEDDEDVVDDAEDDEPSDDEDDADSDDSDDEQGDGEAEEAADDEEAGVVDAGSPGTPTLPDAHRRSLKAYGWQDNEIDQNLKALGDSFLRTAERLHENRNTELQQWAAAGRATREQTVPGQQPATQGTGSQAPSQSQSAPKALTPIDADALKRQYGDDEMVDAIVGPVNAAITAMNSMIPQVQQAHQVSQQAEIEEMGRQVDKFFGDDSLKGYTDLYGDHSKGLTQEQYDKRVKVLDMAYDLRVGASQVHNRNMGLSEAMQLAHEIVAKDFHSSAARKSLTKQAKQRNKGILQKPTSKARSSATDSGQPLTRDRLVAKTEDRLKAVFGR